MKAFILKHKLTSPKRLLCLCYAAFFVVSVLFCAGNLARDRIRRMTGSLFEQTVSVEQFDLYNVEKAEGDNLWVSTTSDPRMLLRDCPERITRVDFTVRYLTQMPGEFTLFYMPKAGMEEFDANYRLWAYQKNDTQWSFNLSGGKTYGLRIDPGIFAGTMMEITDITLNAKQPALSFFVPGRSWAWAFVVFPALIASALDTLLTLFVQKNQGKKPKNVEGK